MMSKVMKQVLVIFIAGFILGCLVWYFVGFEMATISLVLYGLTLEVLSFTSKKEK